MTGVVVGGGASGGGGGRVVGRFLGVLLVGVLSNGINLVGVDPFYLRVALGVLLIGAVAVQQWRQGRAERARTRVAAAS
jgi:ribose/xylose/arabinose/galactoside ABC-type transport system permease subunit